MSADEEKEAIERWLNSPETDEPVPDFVDRELEKPFEFDLSIFREVEEDEVELSPGFAERVVAAVLGKARGANVLDDVLKAAQSTEYADCVALFVAALIDSNGFALAVAVRAEMATGPDPTEYRDRNLASGVRDPLAVGSVPVELLARIVEALPDVDAGERRTKAQLIRGIHACDLVPVLVVDAGTLAAIPFEMLNLPESVEPFEFDLSVLREYEQWRKDEGEELSPGFMERLLAAVLGKAPPDSSAPEEHPSPEPGTPDPKVEDV